jgi:LmbE family N-acetylglucosaminyl deacetylase
MKKNKIAVIAAHPDDEVLGLGGTLLSHKAAGDAISILLLGDGETARNPKANIQKRAHCAQLVAKYLKAVDLQQMALPDNQFDTISLLSLTKIVEQFISKHAPDIIYTHSLVDLNIDHRKTHEAVMTACRPQPGFFVKEIRCFETPSSTEWHLRSLGNIFSPQVYVGIAAFIEEKLKLLKLYQKELRPFPHARSLESIKILARYRGGEVGMKYAEAFELVRRIINTPLRG